MNRYIQVPADRPLVAITGQAVQENKPQQDGSSRAEPVVVGLRWFAANLLQDPSISAMGFEGMQIATDVLRAIAAKHDGVVELPDAPHWKKLSDIARNPTGRAAYDARFADTQYEFALAIIGASLTDPREAAQQQMAAE